MKNRRIGFAGLGAMGAPMASNLINKGFKLSVFNRTISKTRSFSQMGCSVAATPKELAQISNTIITMLENEKALEDVLYGPIGIFAGFSAGCTLINMSTISRNFCLKVARSCFERGIKFLDSPVHGNRTLAESGYLVILCGCEKKLLQENLEILNAMGKTIINPGPPPAGTSVKLAINVLIAEMTLGLCESVAFTQRMGVDAKHVFETIKNSPDLDCGYFTMKESNILKREFFPAFSVKNMLKDLDYAKESIKDKGLCLPATECAISAFDKAFKAGFYNEDITCVLKTLES